MDDLAAVIKRTRERYGLSRSQFAEKCWVSPRQIARIESGETKNPHQHTRKRIVLALQDITKDDPPDHAEAAPPPNEVSETAIVDGKFLPELQLAFDLVQHRYGWSEQRLIALAPLMFVMLVERCIVWQEQRLADLQDQLGCLDEQLSRRLRGVVRQDAMLRPVDVHHQRGLPQHFHEIFSEFLSTLAADIPNGRAEPMLTDRWSGPQGRVCDEDLRRITGGSNEAQWALAYGDVALDEIPEELMSDEKTGERARWLEDHLSPKVKSMLRRRAENGLPVGTNVDEEVAGRRRATSGLTTCFFVLSWNGPQLSSSSDIVAGKCLLIMVRLVPTFLSETTTNDGGRRWHTATTPT